MSFEFVVSGLAKPFGPDADSAEWDRQMVLRRQNMCLLADSDAASDFVPVMDDVVTGRVETHSAAAPPHLNDLMNHQG